MINCDNVRCVADSFTTISISIDGYNEQTCSVIRGKGVYAKVMKAINLLLTAGYESKNISLSMVETSVNHSGVGQFYSMCEELNITPLVRVYSATGRGAQEEWLKVHRDEVAVGAVYAESDILRENIDISRLACQNCGAGRTKLAINQGGEIFPCLVFVNREYSMGNIFKKGILNEIWKTYSDKSSKIDIGYKSSFFNKHLIESNTKCSKCDVAPFCRMCPESFDLLEQKIGLDGICQINKEFLQKIVWE